MKEKRKFNITVIVEKIPDSSTSNFKLQLDSVFEDDDLPDFYKNQPEGILNVEGDDKKKYLEMMFNFLKNNLEVS